MVHLRRSCSIDIIMIIRTAASYHYENAHILYKLYNSSARYDTS